jgi:uroporphyrinogen decarboxylase
MFDLVAAYPDPRAELARPGVGSQPARGQARFRGAVCGGLEHWEHLLRGDPEQIRGRVREAVEQTGGKRLIVSTGCVAPVNAPFSNLRAVRGAVQAIA